MPAEYRSNFIHLYFDIAWFGVLGGSAIAFVAVYAARLGADAFQIGLLNAGPAVVNLILALPAGQWLVKQPIGAAVFWTAVGHRGVYLLWILLPSILYPQEQVWAYVALTLLMSIPGTALAVGFNALFADAVPLEWRGQVVGIRHALLAVTYIASSLVCGQILSHAPFPLGYQIVFGIGFVGATMSSLHLWFVTPLATPGARPRLRSLVWRGWRRAPDPDAGVRPTLRRRARRFGQRLLRPEIVRGPFGRVLAVLFLFHLTQYLPMALFPIVWVHEIHLTDQAISLGTALFYVAVFLGSTRFNALARRLGNQQVTALGALLISFYPLLIAFSHDLGLFLVASAIGGLGSALLSGGVVNYLLENVPSEGRPAYLAWYNLALNAAVLIGSTVGPLVASRLGFVPALLLFAGYRLLSAGIIWRWK